MLKFSYPEYSEKKKLVSLCKDTIEGCEAYTFLKVNRGPIPDGSFFVGKDDNGVIRSVVFNNGDEHIKVYGEEFSTLFNFDEKCLMIYEKTKLPHYLGEEITGTEIHYVFQMLNNKLDLSYDEEQRYVARVKAVNKGLAKVYVFCVVKLIAATASISSMNEKYAYISDVYTHHRFRERGLAKICIDCALHYCISNGPIPFLRCNEEMRPYYEKLGFTYHGKM